MTTFYGRHSHLDLVPLTLVSKPRGVWAITVAMEPFDGGKWHSVTHLPTGRCVKGALAPARAAKLFVAVCEDPTLLGWNADGVDNAVFPNDEFSRINELLFPRR